MPMTNHFTQQISKASKPNLFKETEELWTRFYMLKAALIKTIPTQDKNKIRLQAIESFLNAIEKVLEAIDESLTYGESL